MVIPLDKCFLEQMLYSFSLIFLGHETTVKICFSFKIPYKVVCFVKLI